MSDDPTLYDVTDPRYVARRPPPDTANEVRSFLHVVYRAMKMVTAYLEKTYHF